MCERELLRSVSGAITARGTLLSLRVFPSDAAELVRTIFRAVKYIHDSGIVHRGTTAIAPPERRSFNICFIVSDLKPENLLFRTQMEEADIMIADFGLSRIMEEEKLNKLTEICGTPGVCTPSSLSFFGWF